MKNIGIFGGTYNPIHLGHLIVAQEVLEKLDLDEIIFIPSGNPPHKSFDMVTDGCHRYKMIELAIKKNNRFKVSDIEILRPGKTYTYDTLKVLRKMYSEANIYFLIGHDALKDMVTWKKISEVLEMVSFIVVNRMSNSHEIEMFIRNNDVLSKGSFKVIEVSNIDISSTKIRQNINEDKSVEYLLPNEVYEYIASNKLYRKN